MINSTLCFWLGDRKLRVVGLLECYVHVKSRSRDSSDLAARQASSGETSQRILSCVLLWDSVSCTVRGDKTMNSWFSSHVYRKWGGSFGDQHATRYLARKVAIFVADVVRCLVTVVLTLRMEKIPVKRLSRQLLWHRWHKCHCAWHRWNRLKIVEYSSVGITATSDVRVHSAAWCVMMWYEL